MQDFSSNEPLSRDQLLMECWPDDPAMLTLSNNFRMTNQVYQFREYKPNAFLAKAGEHAECVFNIIEGDVLVHYPPTIFPYTDGSDSDLEDAYEDAVSFCY